MSETLSVILHVKNIPVEYSKMNWLHHRDRRYFVTGSTEDMAKLKNDERISWVIEPRYVLID